MGWFTRLRGTLTSARASETFDEEARFHLDQRIQENLAAGMSPEQAQHEANQRFGSVIQSRERTRDEDTVPWLRDLGVRPPSCTATNAASSCIRARDGTHPQHRYRSQHCPLHRRRRADPEVASCRNAPPARALQLARGSPVHAERHGWREDDGRSHGPVDEHVLLVSHVHPVAEANTALAELFAFYAVAQLNVIVEGPPEVASGQYVSGAYFRGLGVRPRLGRLIGDADDRTGAPLVATITHSYWQRRFNGDMRNRWPIGAHQPHRLHDRRRHTGRLRRYAGCREDT